MYGMQLVKPDGSIWLSPDFTPVNLISRGDMGVYSGSVFTTPIPFDRVCFFFVRMGGRAYSAFTHINNGGYHALRLDKTDNPGWIKVYAFSDMVTPPGDYGIAFYNSAGDMVYHGKMLPLEAHQIPINGLSFDVNLGYTCAVSPQQTAINSVPTPQIGGHAIYESQSGASGTSIYSIAKQVAHTPGPLGVYYSPSILVIDAAKYD